ncbi:hypothetical protein VNO77_24883 [Canavalia gladiata]|uniref:Uncharacterized protein n=1 Tax=Canavalia gladiata TaxID=3824 RepID=A0AAN9L750_CANGL
MHFGGLYGNELIAHAMLSCPLHEIGPRKIQFPYWLLAKPSEVQKKLGICSKANPGEEEITARCCVITNQKTKRMVCAFLAYNIIECI